jgi:hypothetical protein
MQEKLNQNKLNEKIDCATVWLTAAQRGDVQPQQAIREALEYLRRG